VKELFKLVLNYRSYPQKSGCPFLDHPVQRTERSIWRRRSE